MVLAYLFSWVIFCVKAFLWLLAVEMTFVRFLPQQYKYWYYKKQGVKFVTPVLPVVGSLLRLVKVMRAHKPYAPFYPLVREQFGDNPPGVVAMMSVFKPLLIINKPEYLTDLYISKNKILDKDPGVKMQVYTLLGDSSFMIPGSEEQQRKRKLLGSAFYRERMEKMMDITKDLVAQKIEMLEKKYLNTDKSFDIISELNDLHTRIILTAAFGQSVTDVKLDYIHNGVTEKKPLGWILRSLLMHLMYRGAKYEICILPYIGFFFYSQSDKEYLKNVKALRDYCRGVAEERKKNINDYKDQPDVLTLLILDESYANNPDVMVDECIAFFLAGSQTLKSANSNLISYLTMHPQYYEKLMKEVKEKIVQDYLEKNPGKPVDIRECFTSEKVQDLSYFMLCFNEVLRIEPPPVFSSTMLLLEDETINGLRIKGGDNIIISFHQLHHDPDQWIDHNKFIPDRFDHTSPYYLKPNGEKRHPLAFTPFSGGKRICIGKTFAETVAKYVVPAFFSRLRFEFEDPKLMTEKPYLNIDMLVEPIVKMRIRKAQF